MVQRKSLNIGLFGFGCVGGGLYEVIEKTPALQAKISRICVKNPNKIRSIDASHFTYDKLDILNDASIDIVVELIDDPDAAFDIVVQALKNGKPVVTANKKMVAEHFETLLALQAQCGVPVLYEASVCASIPIIRNLEEYYDNDLLAQLRGIVNGSTNYILSKTATENISFSDALKNAQDLGYAESNPILDTGGFDAKYKLLILLAHAFGIVSKPEDLLHIGIQHLGDLEVKYAKEKGYKIKLLASAFKNGDNGISAFVAPWFVKNDDQLFQVDGVYNGVILQSAFAENQFFFGRGAGAFPTASAVLSDISALAYDYRYEYKKINLNYGLALCDEVKLVAMVKHHSKNIHSLLPSFSAVYEQLISDQEAYIIGELSFKAIKALSLESDVSIIINKIIYN